MASLPYPRSPPNSFHRTHSKFVCASPPTEFTEFTEVSGGEYPPTDFTDFHRSRRVWHPCHTHAALRIPSTEPIPSLFAQVLPRNSRNSQKLQAEDILPRISQIFTEASGGEEPPTDFTDAHGFLGCVLPPNLCTSVQSVGVFVGGYGIPAIPTPPSEFLPQNPFQVCLRKSSHRTHRIHRNFWQRIFSHGIHGIHRSFWRRIFSHGIHRIHRSFWRRIFSHRLHRYAQIFLLRQSFLCVP